MKRIRARAKALTDRRRRHEGHSRGDRGALPGNHFRTGNAADKFQQIDRHVTGRVRRLLIKRQGRNLRARQIDRWNDDWL
jgi:RNA-directed DNA polymerase